MVRRRELTLGRDPALAANALAIVGRVYEQAGSPNALQQSLAAMYLFDYVTAGEDDLNLGGFHLYSTPLS